MSNPGFIFDVRQKLWILEWNMWYICSPRFLLKVWEKNLLLSCFLLFYFYKTTENVQLAGKRRKSRNRLYNFYFGCDFRDQKSYVASLGSSSRLIMLAWYHVIIMDQNKQAAQTRWNVAIITKNKELPPVSEVSFATPNMDSFWPKKRFMGNLDKINCKTWWKPK